MAKRTVIAPDEELLVQGKLTITGNVTQVETTQTVNRLESDELVINADGSAATAKIVLNSSGSLATLQYANSQLEINVPISTAGNVTGNFVGDLIGNVTGNVTGDVTGNLTGDVTGQVSDISNHTTDNLTQGSTNLYFTDALARAAISSVDNGGDGSLTYNSTSGVITYTGPDQTEANARIDARLSGGTGISYASGVISTTDSEIVHDNLSGFVADEHVDHSSVTLTAGDGLTGGGDITASRNFAVDGTVVRTSGTQTISGEKTFTGQVNISADIIPSAANTYNLGSWANHFDQVFANVLHAERLDLGDADLSDVHATFYAGTPTGTILNTNTAGGLIYAHNAPGSTNPGGYYRVNPGDGIQIASDAVAVDSTVVRTSGTQTVTGTLDLTGAVVTATTQANTDNSTKVATTGYVTTAISDLINGAPSALDTLREISDSLANNTTLANTLIAKIDGANTNISTNTSDISDLQGRNLTAGSGLTGGGTLSADRTFNVGQGTGITVNADTIQTNDSQIVHDNLSGFVADEHIDHSGVILTAGDGLTGGGDITASRSFDVDSTVIRTTGNQSIAGTKTFTGELVTPSSSSTTAGAIYYDNAQGKAYIYVGGQAKEITPAVDAGDVEDVGVGEVNIYAGARLSGNTTFHGIKSVSSGTYTTVSEAANVITVDGDISAIRGAFSASDAGGLGSFSYNGAGTFTYTGPSDSDIRTLISGTGLISYNSGSGQISTSADNYNSWKFTTPTTGNVNIGSGELLTFSAGTGIGISHSGSTITIVNTNAADITGVTAGLGLTGGGTGGTVTLNIGAGDGITVNADNVAVNSSVVRTSGTQSIAGDKTFTGSTQINSLNVNSSYTLPTADGSTNQVLATNGSGELSFQDVTAIGGTITGVTAGDGLTGGGVAGTVTLDVVGGYGITANANNIEVSNADIRGLFSASGDISYNSSTGVFSFTNDAGDIESVSAGNGLTGGGTSGAVTLNVGAGTGITVTANEVSISQTSVTAGTYGSPSKHVTFSVDAQGRLTAASQADIAIASSQVSGLASSATTDTTNASNISSGTLASARLPDLTVADFAGSAIQTSAEAFTDSDAILMTAAAVEDKILSYGYSTTIGDITGVTAGIGLSGGGTSGTVSLALNFAELTDMTADIAGTTEFILQNGATESRKAASEIKLSAFNDDLALDITIDDPLSTGLTILTLSDHTGEKGSILVQGSNHISTSSAASGELTITSDATSANTGGTIVARDGSGNFSAGVITATATAARYADLAEKYASDAEYAPGTVVVFGGEKEITTTDQINDHRVAGVISTDPAYMMNTEADGQYVALRGRVPCKVIGPVKKGDVLITSDKPGFATSSKMPQHVSASCIVGKALENFEGTEGVIEIVV